MSDLICLIVDDEPAIRAYLRAILERDRFNCLEAESAPQALRIAMKLDGRIDLIVTDIRMPGDIDGIDLAFSIRNAYPALPILIISGYADEENVRRLGRGFELIRKPFVPETILQSIRKAVPASKPGGIAASVTARHL